MIFEHYLVPDLYVEHFYTITPQYLMQMGIRGLICDIDNTLATYEQPDPPEDVVRWCAALREAGIRISFVSNNEEARVARFNQNFGFPAYPNSRKPLTACLHRAMKAMGTDVTNTAVLGDQLLTDALAGKRCGLTVFIVPPIKDKKTFFFRFKRWLERPYLNLYRRRHMAT